MNKPTRRTSPNTTGTRDKAPQHTKKTAGNIRIIGGKHRGRKLTVLDAEGLRPTTDRVKETVFNWLMPYVLDSQCLDCFSGSGGLGFEAMSRGAKHVHLLELDKRTAKQLSTNKLLLKADNISINQTDCLQYLSQSNAPENRFDLVFIDPPFRKGLVSKTCDLLAPWLADNALIYIEMETENTAFKPPTNWHLRKEKIAGQVAYRLYQLAK